MYSALHKFVIVTTVIVSTSCAFFVAAETHTPKSSPSQASLVDLYARVIEKSETLKLREENIAIAIARYREAVAALYPQIHASVGERVRNGSKDGRTQVSDLSTGSFYRGNDQFETAVSFTQPLFTGFRETLVSDALQLKTESERLLLERDKQLLYLDLATLYYQTVLYRNDTAILKESRRVLEERINELKSWITLGKSRESEILQAEAEKAGINSVIEKNSGLEKATLELLSFLVDAPASSITIDSTIPSTYPMTLDTYLVGVKERPDLQSVVRQKEAASKLVTAAERERWPNISLEGSIYPYTAPQSDRDWDLQVRLDLPLFDGGAIDERTAQARSEERTQILRYQELLRNTESQIRSTYEELKGTQNELKRLGEQDQMSRKNYLSQKADYQNGVVTNLEVLNSISQMQDTKRKILSSKISSALTAVKLAVASGGIPR